MNDEPTPLAALHSASIERYQAGERLQGFFSAEELAYLRSVGLSAPILYDYVEDLARYGDPAQEVFLEVAAIREEYFVSLQNNTWNAHEFPESQLPKREDRWQGIAWLPRIHQKALCFLEGTLPHDVMYGCSGDRAFLKKHDLSLPDFLLRVRSFGDDLASIAVGF